MLLLISASTRSPSEIDRAALQTRDKTASSFLAPVRFPGITGVALA